MADNFNRGEFSLSLAEMFAIKGRVANVLDPTIVPGLIVGDMTQAPYNRIPIPALASSGRAAVAAQFGYIGVRASPDRVLQVRQIVITNDGATAVLHTVRYLSAANIAAAATAAAFGKLRSMSPNELETDVPRPSEIFNLAHTTSSLGTSLFSLLVPATDTLIWDIPVPGFFMRGDDPGGRGGVSVVRTTANELCRVSYVCAEWPLPGQ